MRKEGNKKRESGSLFFTWDPVVQPKIENTAAAAQTALRPLKEIHSVFVDQISIFKQLFPDERRGQRQLTEEVKEEKKQRRRWIYIYIYSDHQPPRLLSEFQQGRTALFTLGMHHDLTISINLVVE